MRDDNVLRSIVESLADDVGRLRRGVDPESSLVHAVDRLAGGVERLDGIVHPTVAELAATVAPGDERALREAFQIVDKRVANLRWRMRPTNGRSAQ